MRNLIITITVLFTALYSQGQSLIKGQVLDKYEKHPIPFALINVMNNNSKDGTVADKEGYFEFETIIQDSIKLDITFPCVKDFEFILTQPLDTFYEIHLEFIPAYKQPCVFYKDSNGIKIERSNYINGLSNKKQKKCDLNNFFKNSKSKKLRLFSENAFSYGGGIVSEVIEENDNWHYRSIKYSNYNNIPNSDSLVVEIETDSTMKFMENDIFNKLIDSFLKVRQPCKDYKCFVFDGVDYKVEVFDNNHYKLIDFGNHFYDRDIKNEAEGLLLELIETIDKIKSTANSK